MHQHNPITIEAKSQVEELVADGALFYISHSGGKDSQAMYALLARVVPADQIVVIHADLGEILECSRSLATWPVRLSAFLVIQNTPLPA